MKISVKRYVLSSRSKSVARNERYEVSNLVCVARKILLFSTFKSNFVVNGA